METRVNVHLSALATHLEWLERVGSRASPPPPVTLSLSYPGERCQWRSCHGTGQIRFPARLRRPAHGTTARCHNRPPSEVEATPEIVSDAARRRISVKSPARRPCPDPSLQPYDAACGQISIPTATLPPTSQNQQMTAPALTAPVPVSAAALPIPALPPWHSRKQLPSAGRRAAAAAQPRPPRR